MEVIEFGDSKLQLLGAVRGPVAEGERVRQAVHEVRPRAVGVSLGLEELRGLEAWDGTPAEPANTEEETYVRHMARWGEVRKPPPCFVEALRAAVEVDAACVPLDLDEAAYTKAFTECVGTWDMMRQGSFVERQLPGWKFTAGTPQSFALEFDALLSRRKGYRKLDALREEHMAGCLRAALRKYPAVLAVVEIERAAGILDALRKGAGA